MCGIYAIIGSADNAPTLTFKGLKDIEYRGYDSWGIVYPRGKKLEVIKQIGQLPDKLPLEIQKSDFSPSSVILRSRIKSGMTGNILRQSNLAIGHTRWATHGGVTRENAHPHLDCTKKLSLVHNGIVENYLELKKSLKGHKFVSETDSEVIVHLIEGELSKKKSLLKAVASVFNKLEGLNAIVVMSGEEIIACKKGSPLVAGVGKDSFLLASDPNAILPLTNKLIFLEDNQLIELTDELDLYDVKNLQRILPEIKEVDWKHSSSELKNFPHFMLKEITEQPLVIETVLQQKQEAKKISQMIKNSYGTYFVGCGTASYACLAGVYLFSEIAKRHVNFSIGSEFNYVLDFIKRKSLLIAISQSGETIDVIEPVQNAKKKGATVIAITNVLGSTLYRLSSQQFLLNAGVEKAVASTKAMTAMVSTMILLSFALVNKLNEAEKVLEASQEEIGRIIKKKDSIKKLADQIFKARDIYILGRGMSYPVACEAALKIKEVSYIHAEGFAGGELKHGVIALIEKGTPVIVFVPNDETKEGILANAMEVKARGAYVVGVSDQNNPVFDFFFEVSDVGASSIIPNIVFAQLLAYFLSVKKGLNPDKPRNLAKSVVVR